MGLRSTAIVTCAVALGGLGAGYALVGGAESVARIRRTPAELAAIEAWKKGGEAAPSPTSADDDGGALLPLTWGKDDAETFQPRGQRPRAAGAGVAATASTPAPPPAADPDGPPAVAAAAGPALAVDFELLASFQVDYEDPNPRIPAHIKRLDGQKISIVGYMMPFTTMKNIREFVVLSAPLACCFQEAPAPNQIVYAVMPAGRTTDFYGEPVKVVGRLQVGVNDAGGVVMSFYRLMVESVTPLRE